MAAAAAAAVLLLGCAGQARRGQAELEQLKQALPGVYGAPAQSASAAGASASGTPAAAAVTLSILPVAAQFIGENVFLVRETAADNAQLVLSQGVWTLTLAPKPARIVQQSFLLKDPRRWVGAAEHPEMLLSMLPQDLQPLPGCELAWEKTADGFQAMALQAGGCRPGAAAQGLWIERGARLAGQRLTLTERHTGADGALDGGAAPLSLTLERGASSAGTSSAAATGR
jgi:hypothetical protein